MRPAVARVDVVREAEELLGITVVPLHRDIDRQRSAVRQFAFTLNRNGLVVQHVLAAVQVFDELADAALVEKLVALAGFPFVDQADLQAGVQKRQLPQARRQGIEVEPRRLRKDRGVGLERDLGPLLAARFPRTRQRRLGDASFVLLLVRRTILPDLEMQRLRKRVHAAYAHAVQAAGYLVRVRIEFAARVKLRHHDLRRGYPKLRLDVYRNAPPVVHDRDRIVRVDGHRDLIREARHGFVHGIVHHFVYQVVQPHFAGGADVHGRAQAHGLQPLQHFDARGIVGRLCAQIVFVLLCHGRVSGCRPLKSASASLRNGIATLPRIPQAASLPRFGRP